VYDGGDNRYHTGEHPQPADPTRVFNNIIAGDPISVAVEARAALACSPRYMYVEFYNNTVIDFNSHGGFFIGRHAGVGERNAAYIFKGNVLQTSNSSAPYYVNNSTQNPTVTSSDNVYWGGLGGTAVPGDTNSVTGDPLIVSNAPTYTEFSVSNGSPVTGLAADYAIDMQTRDYNHRLYVDRYDSGAILADDEGG
jgi:hypothetical protein